MAEEKTQTEQVEQKNPEKEGMEADGSFKVEENVVGNFKAKENKEEEKKKPNYQPLSMSNADNISDWLIDMFSGPIQDWFIGNLELVGYYADKMLDKANKAIDRRHEKDKLGLNKGANKNNENKGKKKDNPNKTSAKERNEAKAKNAQDLADKAKKNMENRSYDNTSAGKNQKAFDQRTVQSLQHEADYRKKVAENPAYAKSKEGRATRAELIGERKALAAMQKATGVDNNIVKNSKGENKKQPEKKVGLQVAGSVVNQSYNEISGEKKHIQQFNLKRALKREVVRGLFQMKKMMQEINDTLSNNQNKQNSAVFQTLSQRGKNQGKG